MTGRERQTDRDSGENETECKRVRERKNVKKESEINILIEKERKSA